MKIGFRWLLSVLSTVFLSSAANAYLTLDAIVPASPQAGETIAARVSAGFCDAIIETPGYPQVSQSGNVVRLLLDTTHDDDPILCNSGPGTVNIAFGEFPSGSYVLQLDRHYVAFNGAHIVETVGTLPFTVEGMAEATPLPTLGVGASILLAFGIFGLVATAMSSRRQASAAGILAMAFLPAFADAQTDAENDRYVQVLLSTESGTPTIDEIIHYFDFSPPAGPAPLDAFSKVPPSAAGYLLPIRATGDFLAYLQANPNTARAKLERYVLIGYSPSTNIAAALSSLQDDPYVEFASLPQESEFHGVSLVDFGLADPVASPLEPLGAPVQYGWNTLNIADAWQLAGGHTLIGVADSGVAPNHAALRQFSAAGAYLGGNLNPGTLDLGDLPLTYDADIDEVALMALGPNSVCNPDSIPNYVVEPANAGHGTHVSGLIAANGASGLGVKGTCKNCGLAMWKVAKNLCVIQSQRVELRINAEAIVPAITYMSDTGVQVISLSFGATPTSLQFCEDFVDDVYCLALKHAINRDVVVVAASGNNRTRLRFPARDTRVIGVGGYDSNVAFWDESPGSTTFCPNPGFDTECGSNYTHIFGEPRQELMAAAKSVFSTFYPGKDWAPTLECGDSFGTPTGDGLGLCTGTSMSTPQISGVAGILRSINPLVPRSKPVLQIGDVFGIRTVLAQTTFEAQAAQGWTQTFGHGRVDAAAAARRMLGTVQGRTAKNRATPLFRLYSTGSKDYADTTSPQGAITLVINQAAAYQPQGSLIPGYDKFPPDPDAVTLMPTPRAAIYVLTTEYKPRPEWPALVPLYQMDRSRNFPVGCTGGPPGCNSANRDFLLVTTTAHIEQAHADGYQLRNIQGYIYQPCTVEPACIPPGAEKFYRACKTADDDCATFLESERTTFEAAGYTAAYPSGSNKVLGYAYPYADNDPPRFPQGPVGDGLVDGFELVIGTRIDSWDSDGDGDGDVEEFPMVGVPRSDPCSGLGGRNCPADIIFKHGFE